MLLNTLLYTLFFQHTPYLMCNLKQYKFGSASKKSLSAQCWIISVKVYKIKCSSFREFLFKRRLILILCSFNLLLFVFAIRQ